jgi:hypothetical protein
MSTPSLPLSFSLLTRISLLLLALTAAVLAITAIAAVWWQGKLLHEQQTLLIQPRLELERKDDGIYYEYFIKNHGMGPAQVTRVEMQVDGETVDDWPALVSALGEQPQCFGRGRLTRYFQPQDRFLVFKNLNPQCYKTRAQQEALWQRVSMTVWYQSLSGQTYQLKMPNADLTSYDRE